MSIFYVHWPVCVYSGGKWFASCTFPGKHTDPLALSCVSELERADRPPSGLQPKKRSQRDFNIWRGRCVYWGNYRSQSLVSAQPLSTRGEDRKCEAIKWNQSRPSLHTKAKRKNSKTEYFINHKDVSAECHSFSMVLRWMNNKKNNPWNIDLFHQPPKSVIH